MPSGYVKKLAEKKGVSIDKAEERWDDAKKAAEKQDQGENFAYITQVFKNMMGEKGSVLERIQARLRVNAAPQNNAWFWCESKEGAVDHFHFRSRVIYAKQSHEHGKVILFVPPHTIRYSIPVQECKQWLTLARKLDTKESADIENKYQWALNT